MSEVRPGYKQTEVGEITEQIFLGELFISKPKDLSVSTDEMVTFLGMEDISVDGNIISQKLIKRDEIRAGLTAFAKNDVLVAKITPCFENGKGACLDTLSTEFGYGSTEFHVLRSRSTACNRYIFYHTQSESFRKKLELEMVGTAGQKRVSLNAIERYLLPVRHSLAEQTAIAAVLSDTDALIQGLDQLIAKKRNIKQGAMQELLTGKKRLPGFAGEWEKKKVSEVGEIITGSTPPTSNKTYWNGDIPWITPTDISAIRDIWCSERQITQYGLKVLRQLPANTLLVTCIASIGKNSILRKTGACNQQINAVIPDDKHNVDYLYYLIENDKFHLLSRAGITATNIVSKREFMEIVFVFPPTLAEQTAIAAVLSDMDAEIAALEQKRDKYKAIKRGMMQELLNGKTRLV